MSGISDLTMRTVEFALDGLSARDDVRANNVANVNTPGYQARTVDFEGVLRDALARGIDPAGLEVPGAVPAPGVPDATGNTVSLEDELVGQIEDGLLNQALIHGYNFKIDVLRTAIGGR
ncbi:MAG: flagellar biosynthesis protein FlgB [Actinomycetota bacterium]|nr:MAG: flagellar biosynthesis protein FlgB [Actinomycetota bacterium]